MELWDDNWPSESAALPAAQPVSKWPAYAVVALSVVAIAVLAVLRAFVPALITYATVLILGCGLLFSRRWLAIAATRRVGGIGYVEVSRLDQVALVCLTLACLANGLVIALEVASWEWGA